MGNSTSKTLSSLAPSPQPDGGFPAEPDLSRADLQQVLGWTAQYITKNSKSEIIIIAVGGVVNAICLRSRPSTYDIDWFNDGLSKDDLALLSKAVAYALGQAQRQKMNITSNWFNNKTTLFIPPALREQLIAESFQQNDQVFSAPGLHVIAAPWGYALMSKLDRMAGGGGKPYDADDAVNYLRQYLKQEQKSSVSTHEIHLMAKKHQLRLKVEDVMVVRDRHQSKFGEPGIVG